MNDPGFEILYEQGPCLVVCKPPGLSTQAPPGIDSLETRIKEFLKQRDNRQGNIYLGVPHRLDRPASGAIVFAKHSRAARRIAQQFEARSIKKTYWVGVQGQVSPPEGLWQDYIRKIPGVAESQIVAQDHAEGRLARLNYRTLQYADGVAWLEIELLTGRTHQIRVQAASRGHPVLGDVQYGSTISFGPQHEDPRQRAIALHARTLEFLHPMTKEIIHVVAPMPDFWPRDLQQQ
jgi:23S rRNA pseudouridine1911/1915/1917 synthase